MSDLPTLDEFLTSSKPSSMSRAYVREPGFKELYVRHTIHFIERKKVPTIDIARVEATTTGQSTFKNLIARLRRDYPNDTIYIESVLTDRFAEGLLRMGFKPFPYHDNCFYLPVGKTLNAS